MSGNPAIESGGINILRKVEKREMTAEEAHKLNPKDKRQLPLDLKHRFSQPWVAPDFPMEACRNRIVLLMIEPEDQELESGLVIPASSDERDRLQGIVLATGPGEYLYDGRFVSMEFDDDIMVGDILYIEPNTGLKFSTDQVDYRVITPNEVMGKLRRNLGHSTAEKLQRALKRATQRHKDRGDKAGEDTTPKGIHEIPLRRPYEKDSEAIREENRAAKGRKTKTQILVPPGAPVGPEKGG